LVPLTFVGIAPANAAGLPPGLGIALTPSSTPGVDPRSQVYVADVVKPGATLTRHFTVSNGTASSLPVQVYPDAATIGGGSFAPADGQTPNELSGWTTVSPDSATIPANGTASGTVTVRVPADAEPGERYGVVLAQYVAPARGGTVQVARAGIRMYVFVAGPSSPVSAFSIVSIRNAGDTDQGPTVGVGVVNTGSRALDFGGEVTLVGPDGRKAGPVGPASALTLAPGERGEVLFAPGKKVSGGPWKASATIRAGLVNHTESGTVTFSGVLAKNRPGWVVWLALLALLVVLVLLATMWRTLNERERATAFPAGEPAAMLKPVAHDVARPRR
jgi:hypothetical protein